MRVVKDIFLEYRKSNYFDIELLIVYSKKMHNRTIFKRLGFLLEVLNLSDLVKKYDLSREVSKGYSLFDPTVENSLIVTKWNLRVPEVWKKESDRKK
jgi:predicted transcriptional regulator of viral defense system